MSQTPTTIQTAIEQAAGEPVRARDNAVEVQQRPIGELIEADKYLRRANASANPLGAVFRARTVFGKPGGGR